MFDISVVRDDKEDHVLLTRCNAASFSDEAEIQRSLFNPDDLLSSFLLRSPLDLFLFLWNLAIRSLPGFGCLLRNEKEIFPYKPHPPIEGHCVEIETKQ